MLVACESPGPKLQRLLKVKDSISLVLIFHIAMIWQGCHCDTDHMKQNLKNQYLTKAILNFIDNYTCQATCRWRKR